jgi:hypothetical protein
LRQFWNWLSSSGCLHGAWTQHAPVSTSQMLELEACTTIPSLLFTFFSGVVEMESKALCMLGKCSTTELHPQPPMPMALKSSARSSGVKNPSRVRNPGLFMWMDQVAV